jgi:hypothetical protein
MPGEIRLTSNGLAFHGRPPYVFPAAITADLIHALQKLEPGDPGFIGELATELVPSEKRRLLATCKALGQPYHQWWARLAITWAPILNEDNKWHLEDFRFIYRAEINVGWAREVMISDHNYRFVQTPRGLFTLPEFEWVYRQSLLGHLQDMQERQHAELAAVRRHLEASLVSVVVVLADRAGKEQKQQLRVLSCQTPDDWQIPAGLRLVSVDAE